MKINCYSNGFLKVVDIKEVTFEVSEDRFLSLKASDGSYPAFELLEHQDDIVVIKDDFFIRSETNRLKLFSMIENVDKVTLNDTVCIKDNWFCFDAKTPLSTIEKILNSI